MNQHKTVFAILLCIGAAGNAFADDITVDTTPFTSTKTRAEVLAELQRARAAGEIETLNGERSEHAHVAALKAHQQPTQVLAGQPTTAQ